MNNKCCQDCGRVNSRVRYIKEFEMNLCDSCIKTYKNNPIKYIPPKGELHKDSEGKIICHICGRSYDKLTTHIKGKHKMSQEQYKEMFELNRTTKLTSDKIKKIFESNQTIDITTVSKPFKSNHTCSKCTRRLQYKKNRIGMKYKK